VAHLFDKLANSLDENKNRSATCPTSLTRVVDTILASARTFVGPYCFDRPPRNDHMDDHERDLAETTAELSGILAELRGELEGPPRGPLGLPRPPSPAELLRFTEQYTIPTVIALLEASIRSLELLGAVLRAADGRPVEALAGRSERSGVGGRERLAAASRETLQRLDDALAELQSAGRGEPSNPEVQRLLEQARELGAEVDDRLDEAVPEEGSPPDHDRSPESDATETGDEIGIDVDEELASIKQDVEDHATDDSAENSSSTPSEE
jgi:hypothetical protein